jgi:hypothetical protein
MLKWLEVKEIQLSGVWAAAAHVHPATIAVRNNNRKNAVVLRTG